MLKKLISTFKEYLLFSREIVQSPAAMGAAFPSSKLLAKKMADQLPDISEGYIVELGAGTGVVTQALIDKGVPLLNLIVLERSEALSKHLQKRFPNLKIIHGDAVHLQQLLNGLTPISAVVSSLPLKSLPKETVIAIEHQLFTLLQPSSYYIHYTYDLRKSDHKILQHFTHVATTYIWQNIPPAKIEVYRRS